MKKLAKLQLALLYALVPSLFFSYHPRIPLGATASMNLELSLPLILLALFALSGLFTLPQSLRRLSTLLSPTSTPKTASRGLSVAHRRIILMFIALFAFPLYLSASIFWSPNPFRAFLTAGIVWCLVISLLTIPNLISSQKIKNTLVKIYLCSSLLVAAFCWLQCFLDIAGIGRETTLLCQGCTYQMFGFPHPNGFAIEPQFMGNLLLAPTFLAFYYLFHSRASVTPLGTLPTPLKALLAFFLAATLFLTFSRGAIYAFLLAGTVLLLARLIQNFRHRTTTPLKALLAIPLVLSAFATALCAQGLLAELSPTSDTFAAAINKSISQLTLGHLGATQSGEYGGAESVASISSERPQLRRGKSDEPRDDGSESRPEDIEAADSAASVFSGYVAESTETRLTLTNLALDRWNDDPASLIFGTGLGSAGTVLVEKYPDRTSPKEIIQNQYASLLLETGIVGILLLALALICAIKILTTTYRLPTTQSTSAQVSRLYLATLALAYLATLFFFSGLPNALHIYLLPPLAYVGLHLGHPYSASRKKLVS